MKKSFASDNYAGIHPDILQAIVHANIGHEKAYSDDTYTQQAIELFKQQFGNDIAVYFVLTGTAANVLGLSTLLKPYQAIICPESAHINVDESGAPENYLGSKLLTIKTTDGKLTVDDIKDQLYLINDQHKVQPKVISITQGTELGTLYSPEEIKKLTHFAHQNELYVHMDGARLCNAAASLEMTLAQLTTDVGIDVLSFGGTKNGMMIGEAVIFFNKDLAKDFKYIRKQGMQLASKSRFIAAQFIALLSNDLWLKNAQNANNMAQLLAKEVAKIPSIRISQPIQANAVFAIIDPQLIPLLQEQYYFYIWNEQTSEVRWMTSFDTTEQNILDFVTFIKEKIKQKAL
jgi:threonine aldolase